MEDAVVLLGHALPAGAAQAPPAVELQGQPRVLRARDAQRRQLRGQRRRGGLGEGGGGGVLARHAGGKATLEQLHHLGQGGIDRQWGGAAAAAARRERAQLAAQRAHHADGVAGVLAMSAPRRPGGAGRRRLYGGALGEAEALEHARPAEVVRAHRQRHRLLEEGQADGAGEAGLHGRMRRRCGQLETGGAASGKTLARS